MKMRARALFLGYLVVPVIFSAADALARVASTRFGVGFFPSQLIFLLATTLVFGLLLARSAAARSCPNAAAVGAIIGFGLWFGAHLILGNLVERAPTSGPLTF